MRFNEALKAMKDGHKVKLPSWAGYWVYEPDGDQIWMHCKGGKVLEIRETEVLSYTLENICSDEWIIADETNTPELGGVATFNFGEAIKYLKRGFKVARQGWNGKNMSVAYQKGYPDGIPCNKNTAEAWGMKEGELFKCRPYLQMRCADGTFQMWLASQSDILADDWYIVE